MESIRSKLSVHAMTSHFGIFKEPRGLIRVFQVIFAIFAFATACNGRSSMSLNVGKQENALMSSWSYPYKLTNAMIVWTPNNTELTSISSANDAKPAAEFFVFTAVTAMLLALAFTFGYIFMNQQYRSNELFPSVDFLLTMIWTIFWIAGSSAWAQGVSSIRSQTGSDNVRQRSGVCQDESYCPEAASGNYANIIVSVIFGYLNFILWTGSAWFVFKETRFFKGRTEQPPPPVQSNTFANIGSPTMPQASPYRSPGPMV